VKKFGHFAYGLAVGTLAAALVLAPALLTAPASGQDSVYLYGSLERSKGWGAPKSVLLTADGSKYGLVFESESEQDAARALVGKPVRALGRPVWLGGERLLLVVTARDISPPGKP
jgi:hypothetical protein